MKHLILAGYIARFPAADAKEGFVELTEYQEAAANKIWAAGGAISEKFDAVLDDEKVAEINGAIANAFKESAYGKAKAETIAKNADNEKSDLAKALADLKSNNGKGA